jgi:hypothetical protein
MELDMEATGKYSPLAELKSKLRQPRTWLFIVLALALGAAGAGAYWQLALKPMRAVAYTQYQSHLALMRLYDLQVAYRGANGTYANDLDTLLMSAPDGAQLRAKLKGCVDINTLVVAGDAARFKLEANVLDPSRTSVKIRGPM